MTMRITIVQPRRSEDGLSVMTIAGSPYTVSDEFGLHLVRAGFATDTDGVLGQRVKANTADASLGGVAVFADTSIANCQMSPHAGDRFRLFGGQEVSVWIANGRYNLLCTAPAGDLVYRYCAISSDPTVASNWSSPVSCIGNGAGGEAGNCAHSFVYIEGATLYCYYTQKSTENVRVATANINAPTDWGSNATCRTGPLGVAENGNACVVKIGSTYYMLLESQFQEMLPSEGFTQSWQTGLLSCSTPTGTFTTVLAPYISGRPGGVHGSMSTGQLFFENGLWVHVYHGTGWGRTSFPTDIFIATSPSLTADSWTVQNGGFPVGTRKTANEYDQVADPCLVAGPNGLNYLFYTGANNRSGVFDVNVTALLPVLMQTDGINSKRAVSGFEQPSPQAFDYQRGPLTFSLQPWQFPQGYPSTAIGTWALDNTVSGVPGNCRRYNSSAANGDSIQWEVMWSPGTWQLEVYHQKGPSGGIARLQGSVSVDGLSINFLSDGTGNASVIDTYAAATTNYVKSTFTFNVYGFEPVRGRFAITLSGKNAASSGYVFADFGWAFTRIGF